MIGFVRKRLELKIILTLVLVIACSIGVHTYVDLQYNREDMIRTSERTLGTFAAAIKGSVTASMKKGQHEVVKDILDEVSPAFIERLMIYDETGRPLNGREMRYDSIGLDMSISPDILQSVRNGDRSEIVDLNGKSFVSYYAPLPNGPDCYRCHGTSTRLNGILRVDFSLRELSDLIDARRKRDLAWSAGTILLLVVMLTVLLRRVVYRPVRELRDAMTAAIESGAPPPLSTAGKDELSDLKRSFVNMLDRIRDLHQANVNNEVSLAQSRDEARFRSELQAMFDAMPDGVAMVGRDLRIVQTNRRMLELIPSLREDRVLRSYDSAAEGDDPFRGIGQAFGEGRLSEQETSIVGSDGTRRYLHSICSPVIDGGQALYVVIVIRDVTDRLRTERELAEKTAELARTNRLLSRMAMTDGLTQLYNRRHFDEVLYREIKRFNRRKYLSLSLVMVDIDHFKDLNDTYGHLVGDSVLRELARLLKEEVRETDTVARYGGEEFVIVMPDTHLDGAGHKAEVLRRKIEMSEIPGPRGPIRITISIGVAGYTAGFPHDLVHAADRALYQAKEAGRNTVVLLQRDGAGQAQPQEGRRKV